MTILPCDRSYHVCCRVIGFSWSASFASCPVSTTSSSAQSCCVVRQPACTGSDARPNRTRTRYNSGYLVKDTPTGQSCDCLAPASDLCPCFSRGGLAEGLKPRVVKYANLNLDIRYGHEDPSDSSQAPAVVGSLALDFGQIP